MRSKIVYSSHLINDSILREFEAMGKTEMDSVFLYNGKNKSNIPSPNFCFSDYGSSSLDYPKITNEIRDYLQFSLLNYFNKEDEHYDYYWHVEYDVRFNGNWNHFFSQFEDNNADLLTCHIRTYEDEPGWKGWEIEHLNKEFPKEERLRSFIPVFRISREALEFLDKELKSGCAGHCEVLLPTLLHHGGFKLEDLGGNGEFVRGPKNRNYISRSNQNGEIFGGTFRFRPTMNKVGLRKNMLYHPIKPDSENNYIGLLKFMDKYIASILR
jgi:hypothetical protein